MKRRRCDGWSGAGAQCQRRAADGSERDCAFCLFVRDERALHGCERALVADIELKGFCFLGWQTCFVSLYWSPRLATPALFASGFLAPVLRGPRDRDWLNG